MMDSPRNSRTEKWQRNISISKSSIRSSSSSSSNSSRCSRTSQDSINTDLIIQFNAELLLNGTYHDSTISCMNQTWKTHLNILAPRCGFFKACLDGGFRESDVRHVHMDDDKPIAVEGLLYYLYTFRYPSRGGLRHSLQLVGQEKRRRSSTSSVEIHDEDQAQEEKQEEIADDDGEEEEEVYDEENQQSFWNFDLSIFNIADKYNLPDLANMARTSLLGIAETFITPLSSTPSSISKQGKLFLRMLDGYITLIEDMYTEDNLSSDIEELRLQVVQTTADMVSRNIHDTRLLALLAESPGFAVDLVQALGTSREEQETQIRRVLRSEKIAAQLPQPKLCYIPMNEDSDSE